MDLLPWLKAQTGVIAAKEYTSFCRCCLEISITVLIEAAKGEAYELWLYEAKRNCKCLTGCCGWDEPFFWEGVEPVFIRTFTFEKESLENYEWGIQYRYLEDYKSDDLAFQQFQEKWETLAQELRDSPSET